MARPKKASMDYFPIDVHMNNKMRLLEARLGVDGFGVIVKLWMETIRQQRLRLHSE